MIVTSQKTSTNKTVYLALPFQHKSSVISFGRYVFYRAPLSVVSNITLPTKIDLRVRNMT